MIIICLWCDYGYHHSIVVIFEDPAADDIVMRKKAHTFLLDDLIDSARLLSARAIDLVICWIALCDPTHNRIQSN